MSATSDTPVIAAPIVEVAQAATTETTIAEAPVTETAATETATEQTEAAATETKEGEKAEVAAKPNKEDRTEAAVKGEITKERNRRRAAEETADRLSGELSKALDGIKALTEKRTETEALATETQADARPDRSKFDDPNLYDEALIEWSTRTATRLAAAEFEKKQADEKTANDAKTAEEKRVADEKAGFDAFNARVSTFQERQDKALEQFPDYQEKVLDNDDVQITVVMREAILDADNGPAIAYHLGSNVPESVRISKLSPLAQVFEMGKIAADLARPKSNISKAPAPFTATGGRQQAAPRSRDDMTGDEYYAVRNEELRAARH